MKFQTIIFLVIAFNVVTAILKQRAKKAKAARQNTTPQNEPIIGSREKAGGLGKGLLEQLARELGLKLPEPPAKQVPANSLFIEKISPKPSPTAAIEPRPVPVHAESGIPESKKTVVARFVAQMRDRRSIQDAFVLREILAPPLALRKR